MNHIDITDMIRRHEGFRDKIYKCSAGILTCGFGHALHEGSYVPSDIAERFFNLDMKETLDNYNHLGLTLDSVRRAVVIDMLFNLGAVKFSRFKKMIAALRLGHYQMAADEMVDSKWYGQVGNRAKELELMMRTGEYRG